MKEGWIYIDEILSIEEIIKELNLNIDNVNIKTTELFQNKKSTAKISLSRLFKDNEYPFHNDGVQYPLPPKFIVLQNKTNNNYKTKTLLIDGYKLSEMDKLLFYNSIFKIKGNHGFIERTPILNTNKVPNEKIFRYNPIIMSPIIEHKKEKIEECINNYKEKIEIEWTPNSTLIINNWRILHSRTKNLDLNIKRELIRTEVYI